MGSSVVSAGRAGTWAVSGADVDWDAVFEEELPRVYNYFRYRLGDGPEAEDLASATFEKAWRARHRYRRDLARFSTWLLAIARNVAVDHARRRRRQVPLEQALGVATPGTPEDEASRRSDAERLGRLLETLAPRERDLIGLKYGAGLTNRQIARLTGLGESHVGTLLHRAIGSLRQRW